MTKKRFTSPRYGEPERRMAEALVDLEARALDPAADCDCKAGMFPDLSRRSLLTSGALLGGALLASGARAQQVEAPPGANLHSVPDDPTKVQGRPVLSENG